MYTHYFVFGVYFLPILGAIMADGWLGKYWTILSLSIVYCFGNLTLACMATSWGIAIGQRTMLAIGLFLICLGAGGIKPCVSANVGDQFGESNKHLLSKMFGWFYFSINAGSFISSILCPWLLANPKWGPGWAFGIPGIAMVIATLFFWGGRKKMVHVPPAGPQLFERNIQQGRSYHARSDRNGLRFYFGVLGALGNEQRRGMDVAGGENGPALDGHEFDRCPGANRKPDSHFDFHSDRELRDLSGDRQSFSDSRRCAKSASAFSSPALSFVVIVWIQGQIDAGLKPSINWQLLAYVILTLGEAMVSITGLEFSYTQAPNSMKSSVMALWLLTVASGELFVGLVNKWILNAGGARKLSAYQYFTFFTWLMFGAAVVFIIVACFLQRSHLPAITAYAG